MPDHPATLRVLLPLPLTDAYDYLPLAGETLPPGSVVHVPFGSRQLLGVVWGDGTGNVPSAKLKPITSTAGLPTLPSVSRSFVDWVAQYTVTPPGSVLKMTLGGLRVIQPKKNDHFSGGQPDPNHHHPHLTDNQRKAADTLIEK